MKTIAQQLKITDFPFSINDSKGNQIYFEDSEGFWWKSEYDSNSNEIYFENSREFWFKQEFDSEGNEIYYEDSDGYIEDNRKIPEYTMAELVEKIGNFKLVI